LVRRMMGIVGGLIDDEPAPEHPWTAALRKLRGARARVGA